MKQDLNRKLDVIVLKLNMSIGNKPALLEQKLYSFFNQSAKRFPDRQMQIWISVVCVDSTINFTKLKVQEHELFRRVTGRSIIVVIFVIIGHGHM